jgi:type 1 glutamine amidotransferase
MFVKIFVSVLVLLLLVALTWGGAQAYRLFVGVKVYETVPPELPAHLNDTAILIFSKTNRYRHQEAIPAAIRSIRTIAQRRGWSAVVTDNSAVFNRSQLHLFKAVVWNNTSGDVLSQDQKDAFRQYIEEGGGFVGIHGAGGDFSYDWRWYVETLIGAQFSFHPLHPQFQRATMHIEDRTHPVTRHLGETWTRIDEWYSFRNNPRLKGVNVLATVDERTYDAHLLWFKSMDDDHPIMWNHCVGNGRAFYSALGHRAEAYDDPKYAEVLEGAIAWVAVLTAEGCNHPISTQ